MLIPSDAVTQAGIETKEQAKRDELIEAMLA
jgi:hypothetical protein